MKGKAPIIIFGAHRSGTSLVCQALEQMGLFVGKQKDPNNEALFFQRLNDWILRQCGGSWEHPSPIQELWRDRDVRATVQAYLSFVLGSPQTISFLGWKGYLGNRQLFSLSFPWGWKDPRNTFTLPLWLDLFPEAQIIHVCRHGVDVASSLQVREKKVRMALQQRWRRCKVLYWFFPKRVGFSDSLRCATLSGAFSLWEMYVREAKLHLGRVRVRTMEVKFEELIEKPKEVFASLAKFCGLKARAETLSKLAGGLQQERAYAYRRNEQLKRFALGVADRLRVYGYEP